MQIIQWRSSSQTMTWMSWRQTLAPRADFRWRLSRVTGKPCKPFEMRWMSGISIRLKVFGSKSLVANGRASARYDATINTG